MAIDKAIDSTQLDSDLTSVANAIRTKGGTSAQLAFPSGFVSAIGDIPTGGTHSPSISVADTGVITASCGGQSATHTLSSSDDSDFVASNIKDGVTIFGVQGSYSGGGGGGNATVKTGTVTLASDVTISASGTVFPGLQLNFVPDYLEIWLDRDDFEDIETPANNHIYHLVAQRVESTWPPIRVNTTTSSDSAYDGKSHRFALGTSIAAFSSPLTGYGINTWFTYVNTASYPNWNVNNDGTITLARISSAGQTLYAGTYHYIAFKEGV